MLGTTIHSHYKIVKSLGAGRSGSAYIAEDLDLPNRPPCLVKKFQSGEDSLLAQPLIQKLFEVQTDILYKVGQHPQIPTLIAKFEEDGDQYLVREYIDGELLSQELTPDSIWSQTQVFDFLMDMVGILSFVHSFKYIHQDINPKNIIRRKQDGIFSLIGFSAVRDLGSVWQNIPDGEEGHVNVSIGTPGYIPYEQEQNLTQFNSDIYAVGVIAIQAITGEFPIPRDPQTYELKWRDRTSINLRLVEIIDRMVRPDYRNRYQSVLEIMSDLQSFAMTQIPPSKIDRLKPHLIFGATACALLFGFSAVKLLSASADKPRSAPAVLTAKSGNNNQASWQSYVDPPTKFKIKYYPTWQLVDIHNLVTGEIAMFTSPNQSPIDKYRENVSVRVENLTNPQTTLAEYTKSATAEISKFYKNAKIIESSSILMAKKPATLVVYTGKDENNLPVKNLEVWTIDRGKAYIITYKADPKQYYSFLQTVMTMINSFELQS